MINIINAINNWFDNEHLFYKRHFFQRRKKRAIRKNEIIIIEKKHEADRLAYITGRKHWVMRDYDGAILVADRKRILQFKREGKLDKRVTGVDLDREAIYTAWPIHANISSKKGYNPKGENTFHRLFRLFGWL